MKRRLYKDRFEERGNDKHNVEPTNPQRAQRQAAPGLWYKLGEVRQTEEVPQHSSHSSIGAKEVNLRRYLRTSGKQRRKKMKDGRGQIVKRALVSCQSGEWDKMRRGISNEGH